MIHAQSSTRLGLAANRTTSVLVGDQGLIVMAGNPVLVFHRPPRLFLYSACWIPFIQSLRGIAATVFTPWVISRFTLRIAAESVD